MLNQIIAMVAGSYFQFQTCPWQNSENFISFSFIYVVPIPKSVFPKLSFVNAFE